MKFQLECPSCGKINNADENSGGVQTQCICCRAEFIIPTTIDRAQKIFDRIIEVQEDGRFLQQVAPSEVGAVSVAEALMSLYLVTAEYFRVATLSNNSEYQRLLQDFVAAAGGTGMWIVLNFRPEGTPEPEGVDDIKVHESVKRTETIDSFVKFLRTLHLADRTYWRRVYARIGLPYPEVTCAADNPIKREANWWKRLFK